MSELTQIIIEVDRIKAAKIAIAAEIMKKGVAVPDGLTIDGYAALIADIMLSITTDTETNITGLIKGNGSKVSAAVKGQDYSSPALLRTATLTATGWSSKTQTVTVSGVLADATKQAILPGPVISSMEAWVSAGVICSGQGANTLIFSCTSVPTTDITVSIAIFDATT